MRIRAAKVKRWQANGLDLNRMIHFMSLVENSLADYHRGVDVREAK
jgi:hypothetical protein